MSVWSHCRSCNKAISMAARKEPYCDVCYEAQCKAVAQSVRPNKPQEKAMTIEDMKGWKQGMEQAIALAVQTFEEETGLRVERISAGRENRTPFGDKEESYVVLVTTKVEL